MRIYCRFINTYERNKYNLMTVLVKTTTFMKSNSETDATIILRASLV